MPVTAGRPFIPAAYLGLAALLAACSIGDDQPSSSPSAAPETPEQQSDEELRAELAQSLAEEYDVEDSPEVEIVREVQPDEASAAEAECMTDAGWPNEQSDGGVAYDIPAEQADDFNLALYTCKLQFPVEAKYTQRLGDDQWSMMYDHFVDVYIPCAEGEGHDIGDIPTKDVYLATPDAEKWFPGRNVRREITTGGTGAYSSVEEFEAVCPATPGWEVLYGDE